MSLLLPNQLTVTLGANSVIVVLQSRGLSNRILQQQYIAIAPIEDKISWQQVVSKLESVLAEMQLKPKTTLQIIIANDFVRYLMLPCSQIPMRPAEQHAYAAAAYREVYGAVADSWHIKLHDAPPNQATPVAAMDERLLATLKQISLKYQLNLVSAQPDLMHVFNSLSKQISKLNGYLLIVESGRLLLLSLLKGQCKTLRTASISQVDDWQLELAHLLARESLLDEVTGNEVLVYAPSEKNAKLDSIVGWKIRLVGQVNKLRADKPFALNEAIA